MNQSTLELARSIYNRVNSLNRSAEDWDMWDDEREVGLIALAIDEHKPPIIVEQHKRFTDEYGNSDWRDTGEMGG